MDRCIGHVDLHISLHTNLPRRNGVDPHTDMPETELIEPLKELTPQMKLICLYIASGKKVYPSCKSAHMRPNDWERYKEDPLILNEIARFLQDLLSREMDLIINEPNRQEIRKLIPQAAETLKAVMNDKDAWDPHKITAAKAILEHGLSKADDKEAPPITINFTQQKSDDLRGLAAIDVSDGDQEERHIIP